MAKDNTFDFNEEFRSSRIREVGEGEFYWTEVDILEINDLQTANNLRSSLESFGIKVNIFGAAQGRHVVKVLGSNEYAKAPYLLICAHGGDEDGYIHMGSELVGELAEAQPFHKNMTPGDLEKFVNVKDKVVINVACVGGEKRLADVFINKGEASAYIADTSSPFGYSSALFPTLLFYFLTNYSNMTFNEAFERAKNADVSEFKTWTLFEKNA